MELGEELDVDSEDTTNPNALSVYFEHDPSCLFAILAKVFLYHSHHEIHGGEIVVKEHDLEKGWGFDPRHRRFKYRLFLLFDDHATHSKQPR